MVAPLLWEHRDLQQLVMEMAIRDALMMPWSQGSAKAAMMSWSVTTFLFCGCSPHHHGQSGLKNVTTSMHDECIAMDTVTRISLLLQFCITHQSIKWSGSSRDVHYGICCSFTTSRVCGGRRRRLTAAEVAVAAARSKCDAH